MSSSGTRSIVQSAAACEAKLARAEAAAGGVAQQHGFNPALREAHGSVRGAFLYEATRDPKPTIFPLTAYIRLSTGL